MRLPLVPATVAVIAILAALLACTEATATPDPTETLVPAGIAATPALPVNTPSPTATPAPTETPNERPTAASTPASQPAPEPTATQPPDGRLAPLRLQDSQALVSSLSQAELACIGDASETLERVRARPGQEPRDEMLRLIGCLSDETLARLFLSGIMPSPEPLSLETSDCVRAAFAVIDPREVMTAGLEDDPERAGRAMAASAAVATTTTACLNDQEWERSIWMNEIGPQERADQRCLMEVLGGPGEMAEAVRAAWEGDSAGMEEAVAACGLDRGPAAGQGPADPQPTPTATVETPTTEPSTSAPALVTTTTILVAPVPPDIPEYGRSQWKHWVDADGDCRDTRQEVLVRESLSEVEFETDSRCRVATGWWHGAFTRTRVNNPSELDVAHRVPLQNAHRSGGWAWPAEKKEEYANYLEVNLHLVAVTASINRSRGSKGPEEWRPPDRVLWCEYALYWSAVKTRWELTMGREEANAVREMLDTCPGEVKVIELKG